jgi:MSHA pilin protein MshD
MKNSFRTLRARGATLVELIVSIVVIGVALAGVLAVIVRNALTSADPMIWHQSVAVAEAYLEEILTKNFVADGVEATRALYDDVSDYNNLTNNGCVTTTAACPALGDCACDQNGNPIDGLRSYAVSVQVIAEDLNGTGAANALRVQVTVAPPAGGAITISGYRTNY